MCVLADLCNHTWIPECARERDDKNLRLFIDECDLYEFSCDNEKNYELLNYSDCFTGPTMCPTVQPCPSVPTCPNHRFHRMGQHYIFQNPRRMARPLSGPPPSLPMYMLKGKRRYTPIPKIKRLKSTIKKKTRKRTTMVRKTQFVRKRTFAKKSGLTDKGGVKTIVLRRESVIKKGKKLIRVIKGIAVTSVPQKTLSFNSDFLEK
ncbi:uncharacterized protein ACR2FA_004713 [Aphomia sociella]